MYRRGCVAALAVAISRRRRLGCCSARALSRPAETSNENQIQSSPARGHANRLELTIVPSSSRSSGTPRPSPSHSAPAHSAAVSRRQPHVPSWVGAGWGARRCAGGGRWRRGGRASSGSARPSPDDNTRKPPVGHGTHAKHTQIIGHDMLSSCVARRLES